MAHNNKLIEQLILHTQRVIRVLILSPLLLLGLTNQSVASSEINTHRETITIAAHEYFPYYVNGVGLGVDIYREAFATQNIDIKMVSYPIKRAIHKLVNLEVDAFTPGTLFINDQNILDKLVYETSFYATAGWLHKPNNNPKTRTRFDNETLATEGTSLNYTTDYKNKGLKVIYIENTDRRLKMVLHNRVTYAAVAGITGWHMIAKHNLKDFSDIEFTQLVAPFACNLAFAKENPRTQYLFSSFKKGMKEIRSNGTYLRILENYWGKDNVPKDVLFDELKAFGVDIIDKKVLFNAVRKHEVN